LGRAGIYSANFDYSIASQIAVGAGFSYIPGSSDSFDTGFGPSTTVTTPSVTLVPVYANFYLGGGNHRLFGTVGTTYVTLSGGGSDEGEDYFGDSGSTSGFLFLPGAGYEYRGDGGFLFRLTGYYLIAGAGNTPWGGLSLGFTF
jgi:hypothetical protein